MTNATSPVPISPGEPAPGELKSGAPASGDTVRDLVPPNFARDQQTGSDLAAAQGRPRREQIDCGDLPFVIQRDGTWMYRGTPILRKELVCLFASVLRRDTDGGWWFIDLNPAGQWLFLPTGPATGVTAAVAAFLNEGR